ncbi:pantoate--beta-alanine ligase [bacterium]|nr:pantoate--beta-alanine ligase [bacterium]
MQVIDSLKEMIHLSRNWDKNQKIGFVPTMGALHTGHLALVKQSLESCDITIVSIFVNPAQFGANEDFSRYPKTFEEDYQSLLDLGVDYIFLPNSNQMYPQNYKTWINLDAITEVLCGASRPGHFTGVATIVLKLVNLVRPTLMYMGEKDFQQIVVLETMLTDLNLETKIVRCPIVRNEFGLALSSRNRYLSDQERMIAPEIFKAMQALRASFRNEIIDTSELLSQLEKSLVEKGFKIDYSEIVDSATLERVKLVRRGDRLLVAVFLGNTRLIDNMEI